MSALWQKYTDEIYGGLHYLASWFPTSRVRVGEVAVMHDRSLEESRSLEELGIEMSVSQGAEVRDRGLASSGTVVASVNGSASVSTHPASSPSGELEVTFGAKHAVLFRAARSREDSIDRIDPVKQEVLRLYYEGRWDLSWVLVTHVICARALTVLIANDKGAKARLSISSGAVADASALATARGDVALLRASGMAYEEHSEEEVTPLYLAIRLKERLGRKPVLKRIGKQGRARARRNDVEFIEVGF